MFFVTCNTSNDHLPKHTIWGIDLLTKNCLLFLYFLKPNAEFCFFLEVTPWFTHFVIQDDYRLVRECLSGQIYDSSPVDFTSDLGTRFILHPSVLRLSHPPRFLRWMATAFASSLDALFVNRFEAERAEYWQTLYSSVVRQPLLCWGLIHYDFVICISSIFIWYDLRAWVLFWYYVLKMMNWLHTKLFWVLLIVYRSLEVMSASSIGVVLRM